MLSKENTLTKMGALKVVGVGNTGVMLENFLSIDEIPIVATTPTEPTYWKGIDVGFIVACADEDNSWDNFQKEIKAAREQNVITFPIFVSDKQPDVSDNIMVITPKHFSGNMELYAYIGESIKSIKDFVSQVGVVDLDLEDLRSLFSNNGHLAFVHYQYNAKTSKSIATQRAIQELATFGASAHAAKFMILNLEGSEENLNMFEVCELSELIHTEFGNDKCNLIWGASIDNTIINNIHVSLWLSF